MQIRRIVGLAGVLGLTPFLALSTTQAAAPPAAAAMRWISEPSAGLAPWLQAIAHTARGTTIDWNAYLFTDGPLRHALATAVHRGVRVQVLLDPAPYAVASASVQAEARALRASGATVRWAPPRFTGAYAFDHAKYAIFGVGAAHPTALLGSANATASAFDGENLEDVIATTTPAITHALTTVFTADWTRRPAGAAPRKTLILSPGAQPALLALLHSPGPMALMTEELGDAPALDAAISAHHAQARVLVPGSLSAADRARAAALVRAGVQVRTLDAPYVHAKLIVTATAIFVGSQNLSETSLDANREVGLVVSNPRIRQQSLAWFNTAWHHATPFSATQSAAPTPAAWPYIPTGDTPTQVVALWGKPTTVQHRRYDGAPETVWVYPVGRVDFQHGQVTDVQRSS